MGEDIDVLYNFINSGDPARREWCDCEVRDKEMAESQDRITGDYNDFWAGRDYLNQLDKFKAATGWKPEIPYRQTLLDMLNYWRQELARDVPE